MQGCRSKTNCIGVCLPSFVSLQLYQNNGINEWDFWLAEKGINRRVALDRQQKSKLMELDCMTRIVDLPRRVRGTYQDKFKTVRVETNHYHVNIGNFETIFTYKVRFTPQINQDNKTLRNGIIKRSMPSIVKMIASPVVSGMTIYSLRKPEFPESEFTVEEGQKEYTVSIKQVREQNVSANPKVLIQFLNNGLRNLMNRLDYTEIGRTNKFFNIKKMVKFDNLMMFSGFRSNFTTLESGTYLRVDTAKKIVRTETVLQTINELYRVHGDKERDEKREMVKNELLGRIVMTNYGKTRYYRVENILFLNLDTVFLDGDKMNIIDYYKDKYQIDLKVRQQPLLEVENRRSATKTYLLPELCLMTGIPENFDEIRRKRISEATIRSATQRRKEIQYLIEEIKDSPELEAWRNLGIHIDPNMTKVDAKVISAPSIALGGNRFVDNGKQAFFNLYSQPIYSNKYNVRLGIIYFTGVDINNMVRIFEATAKNLEVRLDIILIKGGDPEPKKTLIIIETLLKRAAEKECCNICFIVIPNQLKQQYKKVKTQALIENRMVCQVALDSTLRKKSVQSIYTKILLQIIAKRGNTLWVPQCNSVLSKTMIIAFESAKSLGSKSLLSVCATVNSTFTSIFSKTQVCECQSDKLQTMKKLLLAATNYYAEQNREAPEEIIAFQNSCSGDQISLYLEYLIHPVQDQLARIYGEQRPKTTFVMVNTKTSERFFSVDYTGDKCATNVTAGTLVSKDIVSPFYDFYMISQACNKGSTVPNHYRVIFTDSKMEEGLLQELIYNQCFNYVNWTGSIKVPGILQYAKKCAKFNAEVLEEQLLVDELQSKLYFI